METNLKQLGSFATQIVLEAGKLLQQLKNEPLELEEKKSFSDLVTIVDQKIEQFLVDKILQAYPTHGILGEEGTFLGNPKAHETIWIIDPIDGTTNFIHSIPFYGISLGIAHKGKGILGVVYNPSTDELFFAETGKGASVNGKPLLLPKELRLTDSVFSTTMFWDNPDTKTTLHPSIVDIYKETRGMRMLGGAAISLCEIAKGNLSAYIMPRLSAWDFAGGVIVAKEAGAIASALDGTPLKIDTGSSLLVAHPAIHSLLLRKFSK